MNIPRPSTRASVQDKQEGLLAQGRLSEPGDVKDLGPMESRTCYIGKEEEIMETGAGSYRRINLNSWGDPNSRLRPVHPCSEM